MDFKKLVPWNWFAQEEGDEGKTIPIQHNDQHLPGAQTAPLQQLQNEMDRLFNNFFRGFTSPLPGNVALPSWQRPGLATGLLKPTLDISSSEKNYTISIEVPGVEETDIKVEVTDNNLTISGEKKQEREEKDKNFYRVERSYGSFRRLLSLPEDADENNIKAQFHKGVLTLTIPRQPMAAAEVKNIKIENKD